MNNQTEEKIIIRDSVHGNIIVDDPVAIEIINSSEFQRLRNISQLANIQLAFPSATHTRFSHCLGVYHLIKKITSTKVFLNFYKNKPRQLLITRVAGLLHDIGHGPFSHTFEIVYKITNVAYTHENYSRMIIQSKDSNINKILKKYNFTNDEIDQMCKMIEGNSENDNILSSLVSSQLDMDRLDYLLRDGYHTGVNYSNVDVEFLIDNIKISKKNNSTFFPTKAIYAVTSFLLARFFMHIQIYSHHVNIGFDMLFSSWFQRLLDLYNNNYAFKYKDSLKTIEPFLKKEKVNINKYIELNDFTLMSIIKNFTHEEDWTLSYLSKCFFNRTIFRNKITKSELEEYKNALLKRLDKESLKYFIIEKKSTIKKIYTNELKPIYFSENEKGEVLNKLDEYIKFDNFIDNKNFKSNNICYTININ
ncbi:HD domain-containing protein [Spiroplasma endosymbiont of Amphibalanus improvisus]|uniref:HD domain-containing protein n=1 Tax=Spiroplasma endosymbiont of Amphibalanus improvisus TaxID=3066327 RepID=UPI00313E7FB9